MKKIPLNKEVYFGFGIPKETYDNLKNHSKKTGRKMKWIGNEALKRYLKRDKKVCLQKDN